MNPASPIGRYGRSIARFWSSSLAAEMEYQVNLLVEVAATLTTLAGSLFTLSLFFGHGQKLGGWRWEQALVVLGVYTLLNGFASTLLRPNLGNLVKQVQSGSLDFVLLKPMDSQIWLSLRTLSPWGLPELVLGLVLVVVGTIRSGARPGATALLTGALMLLAGITILYSLWFVLAATSILVREDLECHRGAPQPAGRRPIPGERLPRQPAPGVQHGSAGGLSHHRASRGDPRPGQRRIGADRAVDRRLEPVRKPGPLAIRPASLHLSVELKTPAGEDLGRWPWPAVFRVCPPEPAHGCPGDPRCRQLGW